MGRKQIESQMSESYVTFSNSRIRLHSERRLSAHAHTCRRKRTSDQYNRAKKQIFLSRVAQTIGKLNVADGLASRRKRTASHCYTNIFVIAACTFPLTWLLNIDDKCVTDVSVATRKLIDANQSGAQC